MSTCHTLGNTCLASRACRPQSPPPSLPPHAKEAWRDSRVVAALAFASTDATKMTMPRTLLLPLKSIGPCQIHRTAAASAEGHAVQGLGIRANRFPRSSRVGGPFWSLRESAARGCGCRDWTSRTPGRCRSQRPSATSSHADRSKKRTCQLRSFDFSRSGLRTVTFRRKRTVCDDGAEDDSSLAILTCVAFCIRIQHSSPACPRPDYTRKPSGTSTRFFA